MRSCFWTLLFLFTASVCCFSQKHFKFMGIPINGNVNTFCEKLKSKGFSKDVGEVKNAYCLVGKFYDEEANLQVNYDPSNGVVYSITVYIIKGSLLAVHPTQRDILKAVEDKYIFEKKEINPQLYQYDYYIYDGLDPIGLIQTFIVDSRTIPTTKEAMLNITYTDIENFLNYENRKRNDI